MTAPVETTENPTVTRPNLDVVNQTEFCSMFLRASSPSGTSEASMCHDLSVCTP